MSIDRDLNKLERRLRSLFKKDSIKARNILSEVYKEEEQNEWEIEEDTGTTFSGPKRTPLQNLTDEEIISELINDSYRDEENIEHIINRIQNGIQMNQ